MHVQSREKRGARHRKQIFSPPSPNVSSSFVPKITSASLFIPIPSASRPD
jgi:hypothetical protein